MKRAALSLWILLVCLPLSALTAKTTEYHLKNGLTVLVKDIHNAPIAITEVWYKVGGADEPNGITGISHALEHMMFRGTPTISGDQFASLIAAQGGNNNAATGQDYTFYYEVMSAEQLPLMLKLEADRMQHLTLSAKDFKKEIQVVMEERRMRTDDNPQGVLREQFNAAAYLSNPYHHPVVGWMSDLEHMTVQDLRHWYQRWYVPNNAILVVAGDVQPAQVLQLAKKYFGKIPKKSLTPTKPHPAQTPRGQKKLTVKAHAKVPGIRLGYAVPSFNTATVAWEPDALLALAAVLDGDETATLPTELVRKKQIASGISTGYDPFSRYSTQFIIAGSPVEKTSLKTLKKAILKQLKRIKKKSVSAETLHRYVQQWVAGHIYDQDSLQSQANDIGMMLALQLPHNFYEQTLTRLQKITPAQVQAVAKKYLTQDRLTVACLKKETSA